MPAARRLAFVCPRFASGRALAARKRFSSNWPSRRAPRAGRRVPCHLRLRSFLLGQ